MLDGNWKHFVKMVPKMTEAECLDALNHEKRTTKRLAYLERLHAKYSRLRARRERKELVKISKDN